MKHDIRIHPDGEGFIREVLDKLCTVTENLKNIKLTVRVELVTDNKDKPNPDGD